jgi:hypothetical protein
MSFSMFLVLAEPPPPHLTGALSDLAAGDTIVIPKMWSPE